MLPVFLISSSRFGAYEIFLFHTSIHGVFLAQVWLGSHAVETSRVQLLCPVKERQAYSELPTSLALASLHPVSCCFLSLRCMSCAADGSVVAVHCKSLILYILIGCIFL